MKALILTLIAAVASTTANAKPSLGDEAVKLNRELRTMHLAIALKMETARQRELMCATDAYSPDLVEELAKSIETTKDLKAILKANPAIVKDLGKNYSLRKLASQNEQDSFASAPKGSIFYSRSGGVWGPTHTIEFKENGVVRFGKHVANESQVGYEYVNGKYSLGQTNEGRTIRIDLGKDGVLNLRLAPSQQRIGEDVLGPVNSSDESYSSSPAECDV